MSETVFIGIDPGKTGGIAYVEGVDSWACKMPATERDTYEHLKEIKDLGYTFAVIEKVHAMPKQGVTSMFTFGRNYGLLRGLLTALEIPFDEVTPQKWQKELGCTTGGDKNVSKAKAQQLFPKLKVTHAIADALLIAEYARRMLTKARAGR